MSSGSEYIKSDIVRMREAKVPESEIHKHVSKEIRNRYSGMPRKVSDNLAHKHMGGISTTTGDYSYVPMNSSSLKKSVDSLIDKIEKGKESHPELWSDKHLHAAKKPYTDSKTGKPINAGDKYYRWKWPNSPTVRVAAPEKQKAIDSVQKAIGLVENQINKAVAEKSDSSIVQQRKPETDNGGESEVSGDPTKINVKDLMPSKKEVDTEE